LTPWLISSHRTSPNTRKALTPMSAIDPSPSLLDRKIQPRMVMTKMPIDSQSDSFSGPSIITWVRSRATARDMSDDSGRNVQNSSAVTIGSLSRNIGKA
jgi:hypothetical protein